MPENETKKNLPFRLTAERRQELKILAAKRGESIQDMLEQGLDLLLRGNVTARAQASPRAIPIDNRWHRMLQEILASGDHEAITAVQNNLTVFSRVLRATKKGKRAEGSGD